MDTTNKPVAYRWRSDLGYIYDIYDHGGGEPLYTHPSEHDLGIAEAIGFDKGYKASTSKTLTDAEFDNIFATGKRLGMLETEDRFRKAMNLTAEEINQVAKDCKWDYDEMNVVDFARAILRKAQER